MYIYIFYRFIVRFPIGLDFLFITFTFLHHLLLSWTFSLSISSSAISASTLSNHVFLGLPTGLLHSTLYIYYIYYRFIVRFPIGLDFLFITFTILLHLLLSWTSSLSISSSAISTSTLSNHVFLGLPTGLLPSTLYSIHFFTQSSSPFLITCPYHLSLPLLMKVVIGSTPTSLLNSSFVLLSFNEIITTTEILKYW